MKELRSAFLRVLFPQRLKTGADALCERFGGAARLACDGQIRAALERVCCNHGDDG